MTALKERIYIHSEYRLVHTFGIFTEVLDQTIQNKICQKSDQKLVMRRWKTKIKLS